MTLRQSKKSARRSTSPKKSATRPKSNATSATRNERSGSTIPSPKGIEVGPPDLAHWAAKRLKIPTGPLAGQPFKLVDYQEEWIDAALQPGIFEAAQCTARKSGKTGSIAVVALAGLVRDGPLNSPQWRGVVTSLTGTLAGELKSAMQLTAQASDLSGIEFWRSPTPGRATGHNGALVSFLAADKATGHAIGADLAIIDESGLLPEAKRPLVNAILSCVSGRNGKLWHISIKGDGPFLPELQRRLASDRVFYQEWAADPDCAIDDRVQWHKANPSLAAGVKSLEYMQAAAERALLSPENENYFRAYDLNQPLNPETNPIVGTTAWTQVCELPQPERQGRPVIGIDLGGEQAMTAAAAIWENGRMEVWACLPSKPSIRVRAARDQHPYETWIRSGHLTTWPGSLVNVQEFFDTIAADVGPAIVCGLDRYRKSELERAPWTLDYRGGAASTQTAAEIRAFQTLVRAGWLRPGKSPVLTAAIRDSDVKETLRVDSTLQLNKRTSNSRIDTLSAAIIAAGYACQLWFSKSVRMGGGYHGSVARETSLQQ